MASLEDIDASEKSRDNHRINDNTNYSMFEKEKDVGMSSTSSNKDTDYHVNLAFVDNNDVRSHSTDTEDGGRDINSNPISNTERNTDRIDYKSEEFGDTAFTYTQVVGALTASLTHVTIGAIIAVPSVTFHELTDTKSKDLYLNTSEVALYSSIIHIGAIGGSIIGGGLNTHMGQRITLLITLPLTLLFWIAVAFSPIVNLLLILRALLGAMQGLIGAASCNYVVEIADSRIRGRLSGAVDICRQLGFLFVYVVGSFDLTWRQIYIVCGCLTTIFPFVGLCFLPNSPRWLVTQGRIDEAERALKFYRSSQYDVKKELNSIVTQFDMTSSEDTSIVQQFKQMLMPSVYTRLILLSFLMFAVHFSGNITIATFVVPIFQNVAADINPYTSAIIFGIMRVVGVIIFMIVIDHTGRKTAFLVSSMVCTFSLTILGIFFFLQNAGSDVSSVYWLPLGSLLLYTPFVCGIQAVTSLLRGEILPTSLRALGASLIYIIFFLGLFTSTHVFPEMVEVIGEEGAFWVFAGSCLIMSFVVWYAIPETKGLSLEDIDDTFRNKSKRKHIEPTKKERKLP